MNLAKTLSRRRLLIVTFAGFVLCIALILHFTLTDSTQPSSPITLAAITPVTDKQSAAAPGSPLRLTIPNISVDATFEYVGLTPKGELAAPINPANVGWYARGSRPGEVGSAVIDGHFGYKDNRPVVFDNLHKLQPGDKLYIEDDQGATISFVVRESRSYDPKADASAVFHSSDSKAHLNLITCEGSWSEALKSYSNRLVVFTDKEI